MALTEANGIVLHEEAKEKEESFLKSASVSTLEGNHLDQVDTNAETLLEEAVNYGPIEAGVIPDRMAVDENERRLLEEGNAREGNLLKEILVSNLVGPPLDPGERHSEAVLKEAVDHVPVEFGELEDQILEVNGRLQHEDGAEGISLPSREGLFPEAHELPTRPTRAIECNYTHWVALGKCFDFVEFYQILLVH